jgi:hypothetical protein
MSVLSVLQPFQAAFPDPCRLESPHHSCWPEGPHHSDEWVKTKEVQGMASGSWAKSGVHPFHDHSAPVISPNLKKRVIREHTAWKGRITLRGSGLKRRLGSDSMPERGHSKGLGSRSKRLRLNPKGLGWHSKRQGVSSRRQGKRSKRQRSHSKRLRLDPKGLGMRSKSKRMPSKRQGMRSKRLGTRSKSVNFEKIAGVRSACVQSSAAFPGCIFRFGECSLPRPHHSSAR